MGIPDFTEDRAKRIDGLPFAYIQNETISPKRLIVMMPASLA